MSPLSYPSYDFSRLSSTNVEEYCNKIFSLLVVIEPKLKKSNFLNAIQFISGFQGQLTQDLLDQCYALLNNCDIHSEEYKHRFRINNFKWMGCSHQDVEYVRASCIMYTITIFNKNSFSLKWIIVLSASLLILLMIFLITLFLSWSDFNKIINPEISL